MLILISDAFDPSLPERLSRFGEVTEDKSRASEADVVLIRSKTTVDKAYIDGAPRLKMVIRGGVGMDNIDREYARSKGIIATNTPEASSVAVAELAFALMLAVPNHIVRAHTSMAEGRWEKKELKRTELYGKTLGLIGCGGIATEVATRAKAFGMNVIGYRQSGKPHDVINVYDNIDKLYTEADYISLHTPLTDETRGMINKDSIAKMKKGVVIVNTGRGKCVIEEDLVAALDSGQVGYYATDVWYSDPPPADCPIPKAKNVLMAPHLGASSKENLLRIGDIVVRKLEELTSSKEMEA